MLSIDTLINVQVSLSAAAAPGQSTSDLLVLTNNTVINLSERYRIYTSLSAIAADFGTNGPEYLAGQAWFSQSPQPLRLLIGRWAQSAAAGQLIGASLTAAQQAIVNFQFADAGFTVSIDGAGAIHVNNINTSAAANLNAVAADITTAFAGAATVIWNAEFSRFEVTSGTTGATSAISYFSAAVGGGATDISAALHLTQAAGAIEVNGIVAESALTAATLFDTLYGGLFYALNMPTIAADADHVAVATFIEGTRRKHFYGCTTSDAGSLVSSSTTDLPFLLKAANLKKTAVQYSSTSTVAIVSALARILTVDYTGTNTAITLMYKVEPGITGENLNDTQFAALQAKNCNVFSIMDNGTVIFQTGTTVSTNVFIDTVIGADVWGLAIKNALFNRLLTTPTKVAQTDPGMHILVSDVEAVNASFATNGYLAGGIWNGDYFGALQPNAAGDPPYIEKGHYSYAGPVALQAAADRDARMAVPIQVAGLLAGAVHTASVLVTVIP